jgi:regulatory protein
MGNMGQGIITALEVQKRNKKRVNVYIDGEYLFSLTIEEAAKLHKGQTLSEAEIESLRGDDSVVRAVDSAARFLGSRPRSEQEVRRNLAEKEHAPPIIDAAIERLQNLGYLDDKAFAVFWVQNRNAFKPASPRALRYELRQKGVSDAIIAEVLADLDADDAAYRAAQSQMRRLRGLTQREFKTKLGAFLGRRGFSFADARTAMQKLIDELETDDPDYFVEPDGAARNERWAED